MAAIDDFSNDYGTIDMPATRAVAITPHDTNELEKVTRGLYVGATGNIVVVMKDGTQVTLNGIAAGIVHPLRVKQVKATNTTATGIIGLY